MSLEAILSLRWRLVAVMCLAYVIVAFTTLALAYQSQQQNLSKQQEARARTDAAILAAGAVATLNVSKPGTRDTLLNFVATLRNAQGVSYLYVVGGGGCIVASTRRGDTGRCPRLPAVTKPMARTLSNGDVQGIAPVAPAVENNLLGWAVVDLSNKSIATDLRDTLVLETLVRAIGLLIFILLSLLIARYILGPLSDLSRAARAIRRGNLSVRVPAEGSTELGTVASAFNDMADALEERIRHLSFLARSGSILPNTFRDKGDVQPILREFCHYLNTLAAGLIHPGEPHSQQIWYLEQEPGPGWQDVAGIGERVTGPTAVDSIRFSVMAVPVLGDALFLAVRQPGHPFTQEEQQVITNFANQLAIAADNAQLFEAQQEALQVKDQFLSIVSHELRTPLTTIKGYAQMLQRRLATDREGARYADNIDAQVSRLGRLVDDLLDVTRFARGQFELTRQRMDLRPVLEETVTRFRLVSPDHALRLELDGGDFLGYWDRDRLEQVLNNLIGNAIKYSPEGGDVTVRTTHRDGNLLITVQDQGVGISEKDQEQLFERFYRGSAERRDVKGLGLGLYVTRRIVEAHGGNISVESEPGKGSAFTVALPLLHRDAPQPAMR